MKLIAEYIQVFRNSVLGKADFNAALREDHEDLSVFEERAHEPVISYEELVGDLKLHGKL